VCWVSRRLTTDSGRTNDDPRGVRENRQGIRKPSWRTNEDPRKTIEVQRREGRRWGDQEGRLDEGHDAAVLVEDTAPHTMCANAARPASSRKAIACSRLTLGKLSRKTSRYLDVYPGRGEPEQDALDREILVDFRPVDSESRASNLPLTPLGRRRVQEA
jgi:hypothetical protein